MDPNNGRIYTPEEVAKLDNAPRRLVKVLVQRMRVKRKPLTDSKAVRERWKLPAA